MLCWRDAVLFGGERIGFLLPLLMLGVTVLVFMRSFRYHVKKLDTEVRDVV